MNSALGAYRVGSGEYRILAGLGPDDWSRLADVAER